MRIKKILIDRAYPLTESFYMEPADFNLIFGGKNESGKTLLFDIMTYLLFRKDIFKHRREIDVKGEIHVEKDGKTIICKGDKELLRGILTEQATTNIFCLRATEFSLIEKPQERKNWWNYVKESLSDMTDINEITSSVKKLSFLTPTETISIGKSKEIEESKKKVGEIESLLKSDVYIKIRDYERLKSKLAQLKDKMWKLEVAQAEKKFRQSSDLLETLKTKREKVEKDFGEIAEQNLSKLIEMETTIKNLQERVGEVKRDIEETKNEMIELDRKYELIENEEHLYADFNPESFRQPLTEIEEMERELAKESFFLRDRWLLPFLTGFGLLFILAGLILKPWIALIGAVIGTLPWIIKLNKEKKKEYLNEMRRTKFNELKKMLAPFTDSIENIEDSLALKIKLDELERKKKQAHDLSISIKEKRKSQQKEREKREKILKDRMERLTEEQSRHREFLRKKGCKRREELESKIKEKNKLQKDIDKIYSEISSILTEADEEKWGRRLLDLKEKAQRLPKEAIPEFTEENLRETKDEISNIEKKLTELSSSVEKYRELLLLLGARTLDKLIDLREKEEQKIHKFNKTVEAGKITVDILQELLASQEEILNSIFTDERESVSKIFTELTGGRYRKVFLKENDIKLITRKGKELNPYVLKGSGTFDQLYFSIRFILAEKILKDKGFFLLDDPFLRFDRVERLQKGMDSLFKMVKAGWQVFYFTLDPMVFDIVTTKYSTEPVKVKELKQIEI